MVLETRVASESNSGPRGGRIGLQRIGGNHALNCSWRKTKPVLGPAEPNVVRPLRKTSSNTGFHYEISPEKNFGGNKAVQTKGRPCLLRSRGPCIVSMRRPILGNSLLAWQGVSWKMFETE